MSHGSVKFSAYVSLPDTFKEAPEGTYISASDPEAVISITVSLCWQRSVDEALKNGIRLTREEFESTFAIPDDSYKAVEEFALFYNVSVQETDKVRRSLLLKGKTGDFEKAFQVQLSKYTDQRGAVFRDRTGYINVPMELTGIVDGVFGLDNQPYLNPFSCRANSVAQVYKSIKGYTPPEVAEVYGFPKGVDGSGECIAIIELGGGYRHLDMEKYFSSLGIPVPDISWVGIDSAYNSPTVLASYDQEVAMNIEVAGAIAPGAKIVAYFAPNTDKGFLNAISTAIHDKVNRPSVISISWGAPEKNFTAQSLKIYNDAFKVAAILGITVCIATGNLGVNNGVKDGKYHVDFPASSPYVLSCGGTSLLIKNKKIISEVAWHLSDSLGGGGGISDFFSLPDYQGKSNVPLSKNPTAFKGRGIPDVAGNADPATAYKILVHDQWLLIGGTSSVAPLNAGLIALINQQHGATAGFINPHLYSNPGLCRTISRSNSNASFSPLYKSSSGWDACTGLGVLFKI